MLTRGHRVKLVVFLLISVLSVGYVAAKYAGLGDLLGSRGYVVHAQLADSGGIFVNAEVTYRGVTVGRVAGLHLDDQGVVADLGITSADEIPAASRAVVADRSAVGEQYVDLRPQDEKGPYLTDGATITRDRTAIPVSPDTLLAHLDSLVSSVDENSLRTVVDETYAAFNGAGPELQQLLDSGGSFVQAAQENLPQTTRLLADGRIVLQTQQREKGNIVSLASGLRQISAQLKTSDPDLRTIVDQAPGLATDVDAVLSKSGTDLGVLFANLLTTMQITSVRTDAIEMLLIGLPVVGGFGSALESNGEGHMAMVLDFFDPPSCTKGYEGTRQRTAAATSEVPPNTQAYCAEPQGSTTDVRGAQNAPYAGAPPQATGAPAPDTPQQTRNQLPGVLDLLGGQAPTSIAGLLGIPK